MLRPVGANPHNQEVVMFAIKIHLDPAEHAVLSRFASVLRASPEDIAYAALDRLMRQSDDPQIRNEILETKQWRHENLPIWADCERSVHAYHACADDLPEERLQFEESTPVGSPAPAGTVQ